MFQLQADNMGTLLLSLLSCLLLAAASVQAGGPKGVFETCPACRLSAMPELKRFLNEAVQRKEYGDDLTVKYIFGKTPTLILYDEAGKEVSQTIVDPALNYDGLHKWIQGLGFVRQELIGLPPALKTGASQLAAKQAAAEALLPGSTAATTAAAATPAAMGPAPAPVGPVAAGPVAAGPVAVAGGAGAAAAAAAGTAPIPSEPLAKEAQLLQQQQRRRRRRRMRQGGAGQGQQQHRRHARHNGVGSNNGPGSSAR